MAIAAPDLSSPKVIGFASDAFGRVCLVLSGTRDDSKRRNTWAVSAASTVPARRLGRKRPPSHGGPTRPGAQRSEAERAPESGGCGAVGPAGPPSCAVVVAVVTARRAGARSLEPRTVRGMADRVRRTRRGGRSR